MSELTDEDKRVLAKYNSMPDLVDNKSFSDLKYALTIGGFCALLPLLAISISAYSNHASTMYAEEVVELKDKDLTCGELYREYQNLYYYSRDWIYKKPIYEEKMLEQECITSDYIETFERKKYCEWSNSVSCKIDKIEVEKKAGKGRQ